MFRRFLNRASGAFLLCAIEAEGAAAPAGGAAPPSATPAVAAPNPAPAGDQEPPWLADRLKRADEATTKRILADLGVPDAKDAKKAIAALKALEDEKKSEAEKLRERVTALTPLEAETAAYRAEFVELAKSEMDKLTERQREAIADIAGEDPRTQLKTIRTMRAKGLLKADPNAPAPLAAPASTTTPQTPPTPANPAAPNHLHVWEQLQQKNPVLAATYLLKHQREISAARAAKT